VNVLSSILAQSQEQGSLWSLLFPLLLLAPLMYFMIVPQRKQKQRHAQFISGLAVGDDVVTAGGIHGMITFIEDDVVHVQVDTDVVIRVSKASLARRESDPEEAAGRAAPRSRAAAADESDEAG